MLGTKTVVNLLSSDDDDNECSYSSTFTTTTTSSSSSSSSTTTTKTRTNEDADSDVEMVGPPPEVTNFPHARFNCLVYPFKNLNKIGKKTICNNCYCFVCDILASKCTSWDEHCCAENTKYWQDKRHKIIWQTKGHRFVGKRIRQHFTGHGFILGTITKWVSGNDNGDYAMFHCVHDDGDEEDLGEKDVEKGIKAFELMIAQKKRIKGARRQTSRDSDQEFSIAQEEDSSDPDYSVDEEEDTSSDDSENESDSDHNKRRKKQLPSPMAHSENKRSNRQVKRKRKKRMQKNKKKAQSKKKGEIGDQRGGMNRVKRMSIEEIHIFLRRLVYCLEKGKVNTVAHPNHDLMVRRCAESQRDEFAIAPNTRIVVLGLVSDKGKLLNGKCGVVVYLDPTTPERYVVHISGGSWHRLRPINVRQIPNRGVTICDVISKPEINGRKAEVVNFRKDGKFVVRVDVNIFCALKPEKLLLPPGTAVVLHSLKSTAALNGIRGCLVSFQKETGRYIVRIPAVKLVVAPDEMKTVAVKPANVWC
jgi:hypothetical protein